MQDSTLGYATIFFLLVFNVPMIHKYMRRYGEVNIDIVAVLGSP